MRSTDALLTLLALAFTLPTPTLAHDDIPCPTDFRADPRNDPCNPLRYLPTNSLTTVGITLVLIVAFSQAYLMFTRGARFMAAMSIGAFAYAIGFGARFGFVNNPHSLGIYVVEDLFIVLSPCAFIAADYVLLGRMARYLGCEKHLLIRPKRLTIVFICSDITTFLIQAAGGSSTIGSKTLSQLQTGEHIFVFGLALQLVSFFTFTCIYLRFLYRVHKYEPQVWAKDRGAKWYGDWRALAGALIVSCIGILIRSVYRTLELSQGFQGHLATTEAFFYALDTLPLWIATAVYIPFWPGRFIRPTPVTDAEKQASGNSEAVSMDTIVEPPANPEPVQEKTPEHRPAE